MSVLRSTNFSADHVQIARKGNSLKTLCILHLCVGFDSIILGVLEHHMNPNTFLNRQYDWGGLMGRDLDS